jgi:hypothetical protein
VGAGSPFRATDLSTGAWAPSGLSPLLYGLFSGCRVGAEIPVGVFPLAVQNF